MADFQVIGMAPADQDTWQEALGISPGLKTAIIEISSADIQGMPTTPKTLLAAPGANKVLWILGYAIKYIYGTTPYADTTFTVIRNGAPTPTTDPLNNTYTQLGFGATINATINDYFRLTDIADEAIQLTTLDPSGMGDGTAEVTVLYMVLSV